MDRVESIALSRLADIISNGKLLYPETDIFKRIFYNAGLSEHFEEKRHGLRVESREENWRINYYMNDRTYSSLLDIFCDIISDFSSFVKLLNCFLEKFELYSLFSDKALNMINSGIYSRSVSIEDYIEKKGHDAANELLMKYPSKDLIIFKSNLNLLMLDASFNHSSELRISNLSINENEHLERSNMIQWLEDNYPNILNSYESANKMCSEGNPAECLSSCRNVITGIFTYEKTEGTKWYTGLKSACNRDKNIVNITSPSQISSWKNNSTHDQDKNKRYNYPRFKTISQIYSFLSDLGPHKDEANINNGSVDYETPTLEDAFWGLRMTESILIWLYQNKKNTL